VQLQHQMNVDAHHGDVSTMIDPPALPMPRNVRLRSKHHPGTTAPGSPYIRSAVGSSQIGKRRHLYSLLLCSVRAILCAVAGGSSPT